MNSAITIPSAPGLTRHFWREGKGNAVFLANLIKRLHIDQAFRFDSMFTAGSIPQGADHKPCTILRGIRAGGAVAAR